MTAYGGTYKKWPLQRPTRLRIIAMSMALAQAQKLQHDQSEPIHLQRK